MCIRDSNDVIRHRRIAVFGHIARLQDSTPAHTHKALQSHVNLSLGRLPIFPGVVGLVAHVADGSTKSETKPARHLPTSGDRPLDAVIMDERRDGPRRLCDDDDESNPIHGWIQSMSNSASASLSELQMQA